MSYHPSNIGYIGYKKQAAKGTGVNPDKFVAYTGADGIQPEFDAETLREGGDGKYDVTSVKTQHREAISFNSYMRGNVPSYLMAALMGKSTFTTTAATTPNIHTISIKTTDLATTPMQPWLTLEKMLVGTTASRVHRITDCKLSSITFEGEAGMPINMTVEGTGLDGELRTTAQTPTYDSNDVISFFNGSYLIGDSGYTTTNFDIKSFSVKFNAVNDEGIQTVSLTRRDIINHRFNVEVTLGLNYTDYDFFAKANYGGGTGSTASFSDGTLQLDLINGSGSSRRGLNIKIPKLRLAPHNVALDPAPNTMEQPLSGMAFKNTTSELVYVTGYNTIATSLPV